MKTMNKSNINKLLAPLNYKISTVDLSEKKYLKIELFECQEQ